MVVSVLVIYPRDLMAGALATHAQHQERVSYSISLAREKIKIQNSKYDF